MHIHFLTMISINLFCCCKKVYIAYECMGSCEKFNEASLTEKGDFYSHLNMGDITGADYMHTEGVDNNFGIKKLVEYQDFYVQSETLLIADVFNNFEKLCLKIYGLDPAHFVSSPGLAWQAAFKNTKVKLDLFN